MLTCLQTHDFKRLTLLLPLPHTFSPRWTDFRPVGCQPSPPAFPFHSSPIMRRNTFCTTEHTSMTANFNKELIIALELCCPIWQPPTIGGYLTLQELKLSTI